MRKLQYPLLNTVVLHQPTDDIDVCGLPVFPEDSDEKIPLVLNLSLNEYVKLASCIDVGSDIAYPDDSVRIWYTWVSAIMCASFCDLMAECLVDPSPELLGSLLGLLGNNNIPTPGLPLPDEKLEENMLEGVLIPAACDLDKLWGASLGVTQSIHRLILDVFELLESASNNIELTGIAVEAIPFLGNVLSSAFQFTDALIANVGEGYAAAYSDTLEINLACSIFCASQDGCGVNLDTMITAVNSLLTEPFDLGDAAAFITWMTTGSFTGDNVVYAAFLVALVSIKEGQKFGIGDFQALRIGLIVGSDVLAADSWVEFCECSNIWSHYFEFPSEDGDFVVDVTGQGVWTGFPNGWEAACVSFEDLNQMRVNIRRDFTESFITSVRVEYALEKGTYHAGSFVGIGIHTNGRDHTLNFADMGNTEYNTFDDYPNQITDFVRVFLRPHADTTACAGSGKIIGVTIRGTGTNPFV